MRHFRTFVFTKVVKPKAVFLQINDIKQRQFQLLTLGRVDLTFEDRVLHTLSISSAFAGDLPQPSTPISINSTNIIGD